MRTHGDAAIVRAATIPRCGAGDEPMYSRNIPATVSVLSCTSDREELSFSNRLAQCYPVGASGSILVITQVYNNKIVVVI